MKRYFKFVLLLGICLIFLTGCIVDLVIPENDINSPATEGSSADENPVEGLGTGKGTLKIYLTDAPGDYSEVNIIISKIEGHIAGDEDGEEGEDEGSWEFLKGWDEGLLVNLIELEDVYMLLASLELESNKYTQLRLFLKEEATLVLEGEEGEDEPPVPLEIPSVYQTGIKLNRPFEIVAGSIAKLTIDFDAEKSVIETGNGKYKMKPVISVSSEIYLEGNVDTGSVSGTVFYDGGDSGLIGIGGASVTLSGGEYIFVYNATTLGDGFFSFINVPVGNCVLNVYADGFDDYFESIIVKDDEDTEVDIILSFKETGTISGIVLEDSETGPLISGATVTATLSSSAYTFEKFMVTGEDALFFIDQLPVGTYDLNAVAVGYVEETVNDIVVESATITSDVNIILTSNNP